MTRNITAHLVETSSLCPRKAFLLMTEEPSPGPHEYVRMIDEQAAANGQAHRASSGLAADFPPGGVADLNIGANVLADAELAANGLQARCDFLTKVDEPSRRGRHNYEPVTVLGTCRASRSDVIGLSYRGLVIGEVQGRQPAAGTLVRLGDRPSQVKLAGKY